MPAPITAAPVGRLGRATPPGLPSRFVGAVVGTGLLAVGIAAAAFALLAHLRGEPVAAFLLTSLIGVCVGIPLRRYGRLSAEPSRREALSAVLSVWLLVPLLGALPYLLGRTMPPLDAFFEAMSSFTATGASVLRSFEAVPGSLMLWRAFGQWVGGIGILVLFIALFPQLAIAGRQLFRTELPGPREERLTPRLRGTATVVLGVYLGLSLVCAVGYLLTGMPLLDAIAHTFATVAAGGFSTDPSSLAAFHDGVDWVAIVFMTLAAVNFALLYRAISGRPRELLRDPELRAYLGVVLLVGVLVALLIQPLHTGWEALRHGLFQTVSIMTTTGFASTDWNAWPDQARALLVALMFVGGSAGSAAGGVKVARWLIVGQHTVREVRRLLHPRAVLPIQVGGRVVDEEVMRAVAAFITLYVGLVAFSTLLLTMTGADLITAFTASAATVGNVGPGLGAVGPMTDYADLPTLAKLMLSFNMYAGRLEIVTVFVIASPGWWRRGRSRPTSSRR